MPLEAPRLDSRTFEDLVREARERIPRFTPEWTNLNDSDPGMTLVKLQAWLTETILFELNRLPQAAYIKFLNLIHVAPRPAHAARAELHFTLARLKRPDDPLIVPIPAAAAVDVDDPDLATPLTFETDQALVAINAAIGAVFVPRTGADPRELVSSYDDAKGETTLLHAFRPFGPAPTADTPLLLGVALRPVLDAKESIGSYSQDVLPAIELGIHWDIAGVGDPDATGERIDGPLLRRCLGSGAAEASAGIRWQIYAGSAASLDDFPAASLPGEWVDLPVRSDTTAGLARTGHLKLQLPERTTRFSPEALPAAFFESLGLIKPPTSLAELKALLRSGDTDMVLGLEDKHWEKMGITGADTLNTLLNDCVDDDDVADALDAIDPAVTIDVAALTPEEWAEIEPRLTVLPTPRHKGAARPLYWIRAKPLSPDAGAGLVAAVRFNMAPATAALTRFAERLGAADGRPTQTFRLSRTPVLIDPRTGAPDLEISIAEAGQPVAWTRVDDFYAQPIDASVYTLDPATGLIAFAPRGRAPVAGSVVTAARYRVGGGAIGNVGAGTITKIRGSIRNVQGVTNPRPASGGTDGESLDQTLMRAPRDLRARDRAVSAEDFADLAASMPGVAIHRAYALANRRPQPGAPGIYQTLPGAVTLVVLPLSDEARPQPSDAQLRAVCDFLDARRLVTTELFVTGPHYVPVDRLRATISIAPDADLGTVGSAASAALLRFLHPLAGGRDGIGWPFGAPIDFADLYDRLLAVPEVRRVSALEVALEAPATDTDATGDVIGLPAGSLPWLRPERIALNVCYDAS